MGWKKLSYSTNIFIQSPAGPVPIVRTELSGGDLLGELKVRLGSGRGTYRIKPGLYAIGTPSSKSPVLVSANYKLSFDKLRKELKGRDLWILVLDTKGINVWCAAGKGTFGTNELVQRIEGSELSRVVEDKVVILPQLGAPGVAAHEVKRLSGFTVKYGPVRACDIPGYLDSGCEAGDEMRKVTFNALERIVLAPLEFIMGLKRMLLICLFLALTSGINGVGYSYDRLFSEGIVAAAIALSSFGGGVFLSALLLPYLPGRSFSIRGAFLGFAFVAFPSFLGVNHGAFNGSNYHLATWWLLIPVIVSFVCQQFTGCSTFTSLSGVELELRFALPVQALAFCSALLLWIAGHVLLPLAL